MATLTDEQKERIATIEGRLANATPGPWRVANDADAIEEGHVQGNVLCPPDPDEEHTLSMRVLAQFNYHYDSGDDAVLIANAPADLSFLLSLLAERAEDTERLDWLDGSAWISCSKTDESDNNGVGMVDSAVVLLSRSPDGKSDFPMQRAATFRKVIDSARSSGGNTK